MFKLCDDVLLHVIGYCDLATLLSLDSTSSNAHLYINKWMEKSQYSHACRVNKIASAGAVVKTRHLLGRTFLAKKESGTCKCFVLESSRNGDCYPFS